MRRFSRIWMPLTVAAVIAGCTAEVEDSGSLPDVDIDVSGGEMPDVDVDPAEIRISTDTQVIVTPDIDVVPSQP